MSTCEILAVLFYINYWKSIKYWIYTVSELTTVGDTWVILPSTKDTIMIIMIDKNDSKYSHQRRDKNSSLNECKV